MNTSFPFKKLSIFVFLSIISALIDRFYRMQSLYPLYLIPVHYGLRSFSPYVIIALIPLFSCLSLLLEDFTASNITHLFIAFSVRAIMLLIPAFLILLYSNSSSKSRSLLFKFKNLLPLCPDCSLVYCSDGSWRKLEEILDSPDLYNVIPDHNCRQDRPIVSS